MLPMRTPGLFWFSFGPRSRVPKITPGISQGGRELKRGASTAISNQGPSDVCGAPSVERWVTRLSRRNVSTRTNPSSNANPRMIANVFLLGIIGATDFQIEHVCQIQIHGSPWTSSRNKAAEQRSELSPRRGSASLGSRRLYRSSPGGATEILQEKSV